MPPLDHVDERAQDAQAGIGSQANGFRHGGHEFLPAVRIDAMVPGMGRNDELLRPAAFRNPGGDGQEDAVAEGDDGLLHQFFIIGTVRNIVRAGEEG